jgi:hypothetical protein
MILKEGRMVLKEGIKKEPLLLFTHIQPHLEENGMFTLHFSLTRSLGCWLGVHYRPGGGGGFVVLQDFQKLLV